MVLYAEFDRLLSFASVHHAIRAEKLLVAAGIKVIAQPTPREIAVSCGQCLLFRVHEEKAVKDILQRENVQWSKLFSRNAVNKVYEQIDDREDNAVD